ncbi:DUF4350 domain-containing protein [Kordia algicida OT-1]|uniref:DUF4350 domain-containing protein n=1 Tax=Kordia algicida OT-1 TaxID=391587 RepID=A9E690_9FLAO|nr:DUF4350 domain-containing protein [Kordia algicida]EDP94989.1 hypothetical protein KAOT1_01599 [Kordia algicida OT-1]
MSKRLKIYIGILVAIIFAAMYYELSKPIPIDWRETYNEKDTNPYDLRIFHKELSNVYDENEVRNIYRTPYEFFNAQYDWSTYTYDIEGTYVSINSEFYTDESSINELLDFTDAGNLVFISSYKMPRYLKDSLNFSTKYDFKVSTKATLSFANENLANNEISYERDIKNVYFSEIDTLTTEVLGYQKFENDVTFTNFIKIPHGNGAFLLHTQPVAFTNFHLLKNDHFKYSEGVLGYIPEKDIFFDSPNKTRYSDDTSRSPLRFILEHDQLRWAWYLGLIFLVVFVLFNVKRKQRIVKIVNPLENTTVDFTKTIGNLFYETRDHQNVVHKKITYFLEHLRTEYLMDTQVLDEKFSTRLRQKSGKSQEEIEHLVQLINTLRAKVYLFENDVLRITKAIENFHKKK